MTAILSRSQCDNYDIFLQQAATLSWVTAPSMSRGLPTWNKRWNNTRTRANGAWSLVKSLTASMIAMHRAYCIYCRSISLVWCDLDTLLPFLLEKLAKDASYLASCHFPSFMNLLLVSFSCTIMLSWIAIYRALVGNIVLMQWQGVCIPLFS